MNLEEIKLLIEYLKRQMNGIGSKKWRFKNTHKKGVSWSRLSSFLRQPQSRLRNQKQVKPQRKKRNTKK